MKFIETQVKDVYIIEPAVFGDHRGYFYESYSKAKMEEAGLNYDFVQDNESMSMVKGTIRGLHFQKGEHAQAKLVRCVEGAVLDVAVDIRKGSPTYKKWVAVELSAENNRQLLIPRGFAHGFMTLTDKVKFIYKTDNFYNKASEGAIKWNDSTIGVNWQCESPILSQKDNEAPEFDDEKYEYFTYDK